MSMYKYKWPTEACQYDPDNLDALFVKWDWLKKSCFVNSVTKAICIRLHMDLILNPGDWLVQMGVLEELAVFDDYKFKYLFELINDTDNSSCEELK